MVAILPVGGLIKFIDIRLKVITEDRPSERVKLKIKPCGARRKRIAAIVSEKLKTDLLQH